jgi:CDGSH-type Zn-finger protein
MDSPAGDVPRTHEPTTTVVPYEDGPLLIRGDFTLMTPDGRVIDPGRRTVALCRCGKSALKPFCDGTHKAINFRAGSAPERPGADGPSRREDQFPA